MESIIRRLMENKKVSMTIRDDEGSIEELLRVLQSYTSSGHSFKLIVDPGDSEREMEFFIDGDGTDKLEDLEIEEIEEEEA